jgi:hypothetical protein
MQLASFSYKNVPLEITPNKNNTHIILFSFLDGDFGRNPQMPFHRPWIFKIFLICPLKTS